MSKTQKPNGLKSVAKAPKVVKVKGPKPDFTPAFKLAAPLPRQRAVVRPSVFAFALATAALEKVASKEVDHAAKGLIKRVCGNLEDGVGNVREGRRSVQ